MLSKLLAQQARSSTYDAIRPLRLLAFHSGVEIGDQPTSTEIAYLKGAWGFSETFGDNIPEVARRFAAGQLSYDALIALLKATDTQEEIPLQTVYGSHAQADEVVAIVVASTANWTVRRLQELMRQMEAGLKVTEVYVLGSSRLCNTVLETSNRYVQTFTSLMGQVPNECEFAKHILLTIKLGQEPNLVRDFGSLVERVCEFATNNLSLQGRRIYVPTNANALSLPLTVRRSLREVWQGFDDAHDQMWYSQSSFPIARTSAECMQLDRFQHPLTIPSGLARLIEELHLLK